MLLSLWMKGPCRIWPSLSGHAPQGFSGALSHSWPAKTRNYLFNPISTPSNIWLLLKGWVGRTFNNIYLRRDIMFARYVNLLHKYVCACVRTGKRVHGQVRIHHTQTRINMWTHMYRRAAVSGSVWTTIQMNASSTGLFWRTLTYFGT